ncbi:MAG: DUF885 family protein, partial [Acidimicrobiia bacterium]
MSDARAIADEYWALYRDNDHKHALWEGDLDHLEQWQDLSEEGTDAYRRALKDIAERAESARAAASWDDDMTLSTVVWHARSAAAQTVAEAEIAAHNPVVGAYSLLAAFLSKYTLVTADHGERYLEKLRGLPVMIGQMIGGLERGRDRGWLPNDLHVQMMIDSLTRSLSTNPGADPLVGQPPPREGSYPDWHDDIVAIIRDDIRPAFDRYREALETTALPSAPSVEQPGLCHLDGGE